MRTLPVIFNFYEQVNESTATTVGENAHLCLQTLFTVLDFLLAWYKNSEEVSTSDQAYVDITRGRANIKTFLDNIPKDKMAVASLNCKSLARSLLYYEEFMNASSENMDNHLEFLQKVYYSLDEPDNIAGIAALRKRTTALSEKIVEHESSGISRTKNDFAFQRNIHWFFYLYTIFIQD